MKKTIYSELMSSLKSLNGRRRERTLDEQDIIWVIHKCLKNGKASTGGGTVANCYGYPASQVVCSANKKENTVEVLLGVNNATKGSAQRPNPRYGKPTPINMSVSTAKRLTKQLLKKN